MPEPDRVIAGGILRGWAANGDFPDRLLARRAAGNALVMEMVYGVARRQRALDWLIGQAANREPDRDVRAFLQLGAYQLFFMGGIPDHAALHETVEAVKASKHRAAAGFVNGVLRQLLRRRDELKAALAKTPTAIRESFPDELVSGWEAVYEKEPTRELCRWHNTPPVVVVHVNTLKVTAQEFCQQAAEADLKLEPHPFRPEDFFIVPRGVPVTDLPGFADGACTVQDPATSASVDLLDPQPGELIWDACASPGGKTALIVEKMRNQGRVLASDLHEDRLGPLRENVARLGLEIVDIQRADATRPTSLEARIDNEFDRILVDVPCTNTGVLARRPDARWRWTEKRQADMARVQLRLLDSCAARLKAGGRLVYSTCSLESAENEGVVDAFLKAHPAWSRVDSVRLFPPETQTDGAFAAALTHA